MNRKVQEKGIKGNLAMSITILMLREQSTMASTWTEMLGVENLDDGKWCIGCYAHNWLGSIFDLIPEEQLYDEEEELIVPTEYEGKKIIGLADGEYLETDELISRDNGIKFDASTIQLALDYCNKNKWNEYDGFEEAWRELRSLVEKQT